jgi:hypothetical protein
VYFFRYIAAGNSVATIWQELTARAKSSVMDGRVMYERLAEGRLSVSSMPAPVAVEKKAT